jgi:hypothetical protein
MLSSFSNAQSSLSSPISAIRYLNFRNTSESEQIAKIANMSATGQHCADDCGKIIGKPGVIVGFRLRPSR